MEYMDKEMFRRKWLDSHTEMQVVDKISKKQMNKIEKAKGKIEKLSAEERIEKLSEFLTDAIAARKLEILEKDDLSIKDLIAMAIKSHPTRSKVESSGSLAIFNDKDIADQEAAVFAKRLQSNN